MEACHFPLTSPSPLIYPHLLLWCAHGVKCVMVVYLGTLFSHLCLCTLNPGTLLPFLVHPVLGCDSLFFVGVFLGLGMLCCTFGFPFLIDEEGGSMFVKCFNLDREWWLSVVWSSILLRLYYVLRIVFFVLTWSSSVMAVAVMFLVYIWFPFILLQVLGAITDVRKTAWVNVRNVW